MLTRRKNTEQERRVVIVYTLAHHVLLTGHVLVGQRFVALSPSPMPILRAPSSLFSVFFFSSPCSHIFFPSPPPLLVPRRLTYLSWTWAFDNL
jgi:hypothetical protein